MGGHHHHHHGHGHHHHGGGARAENQRRLTLVLALVVVYMLAEVVGGILTNSLALIADAGHMLSDAAALALSIFAIRIARRPPTPRRTYGYYRTEILAALANGAALVAISVFIFVEALRRLGNPPEVEGALVIWIASGGLLVNLAGLWILNAGKSESLNVRGAWLHVLSDALGSVGVIVAGTLVWAFGWYWADPAVSMVIGGLVLYSSWALLRESVGVLMEGAPGHIDVDQVRDEVMRIPGVLAVSDLHVWTITSGMVALSAHVAIEEERGYRPMLSEIRRVLHDRFGIDHQTIQLEPEGFEKHAPPCEPGTTPPER